MQNTEEKSYNKYLALAAIILLGIFLLFSLGVFLNAFLGAIIIYILTKPALHWLVDKKKWNKNLAIIFVMLGSFLVLVLPLVGISYLLVEKMRGIVQNMDSMSLYFNQLKTFIFEKTKIDILSESSINSLKVYASDYASLILNGTLQVITDIAILYFILFFMLKSSKEMEEGIVKYLPYPKKSVELFSKELQAQTYSNAIITPFLMILQGLTASLGYWIFGVDDAWFWGMITGVFTIIPVVGCALIWIPLGIYAIAIGETWHGIGIFVYSLVFTINIDNLFRLILQRKFADIHPIITLLGIFIGVKYFGIAGIVFGPLLISFFIIMLKIYLSQFSKDGQIEN